MELNSLGKLRQFFLAVLLYLILCCVNPADSKGPLCLSCKDIPFPRDCDRIIQCAEGERCQAKSFVTGSANALYNVGCSSICPNKRSVRSDKRQITVCDECCDGDYCNRDLCAFAAGPDLTNRTYCLKCDDVLDPTQCEKTVLCEPEQICYTEYIKRNGEFRYRMGCIAKTSCGAMADISPPFVGRRKRLLIDTEVKIDSYCNRCCRDRTGTSGNCNRMLCNAQEPVPSNVEELVLVSPPLRTDSCADLTETSCKVLKIEDPSVCNIPGISHFTCRKTCGTCVATGTPSTTLPASDCFYESTKYQGAYDKTISGAKCIDWSSVFYQNSMSAMFPDISLQAAENRCRDPGGRGHPWCYTSTNNDWEYCPVPYCEECYFDGNSQLFDGHRSRDVNNTACLPWSTSQLTLPDSFYVDGSKVAARNYCRNPFPSSATTGSISEPVCFTAHGFTSCGIKQCPESCRDSPTTNCSIVQSYVCKNEYTSVTLCAKTCGKCNSGLLPGKIVAPPASVCEDNPAASCETLQYLICPDPEGARNICPRTCNRCNELNPFTRPTTPQTVLTTKGPMTQVPVQVSSTTITAPSHWLEWGSFQCQLKQGVCLMTRFRTCSGSTCTPGNSYGVELCTKDQCPDEINQMNARSTTTDATTTQPSTPMPSPITTAPVDGCRDSGAYDCARIKDAACNDVDFKYQCNKTCDLCDCRDELDCRSASPVNPFCAETDLAQKYCRKTCNKCAMPVIPITYNKCGDPVTNEDICKNLQEEICLCGDRELVQLCPNYCGGRCGMIAACKSGTVLLKRSLADKVSFARKILDIATVSPRPALPAADCFYESTKYQGAYESTISGAKCIDWSSVFNQNSMSTMFPDISLQAAENRCRDPGGRGHPWCYTSTNNDWEYCPVPYCEECYFDGNSQLFDGHRSRDVNNTACLPWSTSPLTLPDSFYVDGSKAAARNYCRNPFPSSATTGSISEPVCYTAHGFTSCGIKQCPESCHDSPTTNCSLVHSYVCKNDYTSVTLCAKTCGKCNSGLLPGKIVAPPASVCEDNPAASCEALKYVICQDPEGARNICPRTCNRCNELNPFPRPTTPQTVLTTRGPTTQVPVQVSSTTITAPSQWLEWGSFQCQLKRGVCLMTRFRTCSGSTCTPGNSYGVELCTKDQCPDEIIQMNAQPTTTDATTTQPSKPMPSPITTAPVDGCRDSGAYDCALIKDAACNDVDLKYQCNKTCGLCDCRDELDCRSTSPVNPFCADTDLAQKYCRKTCNKCAMPVIPITYNKCGDPVTNEDVCKNLQEEICLCRDRELVQLCPNYCGGRCGMIAACKSGTVLIGRSLADKVSFARKILDSKN